MADRDRVVGRPLAPMGYQPALDGLRAVSVVAVILYHAGLGWMPGGFFGVEVFFVLSGFLITTLLVEEHEHAGRVSLRTFWARRGRRLLPALLTVLAASAGWAALFGTAEQTTQLRRDLPWALLYSANWGQIMEDTPYFAATEPALLRHLWSLAVEEQWYLIWPVVVIGLAGACGTRARIGWLPAVGVLLAGGLTWAVQRGAIDVSDPINVSYLSTPTRVGGLLAGAAAAFAWRPWRTPLGGRARRWGLDTLGAVGLALLGVCFVAARSTAGYLYPWLLVGVSLLALAVVLVGVHPAPTWTRRLLSQRALVGIGRRSYGLYLWHWPVFVVFGATRGSTPRVVAALAVSAALSEACYRLVELPCRAGALSRWWRRRRRWLWAPLTATSALAAFYVTVEPFDPAVGGAAARFELVAATTTTTTSAPAAVDPSIPDPSGVPAQAPAQAPSQAPAEPAPMAVAPTGSTPSTTATTAIRATATTAATAATDATSTTTTLPSLPRSLAIVGDSQAHSLAVNLPDGIGDVFTVHDGALDGCSVWPTGRVVSTRTFHNDFSICEGWQDRWAEAAEGNDVTLIVIGAWDVFDLDLNGLLVPFGSPAFDELFVTNVQSGIDAVAAAGSHVALLEVACMRPQENAGARVPPLPERGDDQRVAHLNQLLRRISATDAGRVTFVEGPREWCDDPLISNDLDYRWDGVHVFRPGAKLILETIAAALLAIPT